MKSYSSALLIPLVLFVAIGVAIESFTAKSPIKKGKKQQKSLEISAETNYDCDYFQSHIFHDSLHNHLDEYHSISEKQGIKPKETPEELKSLLETGQLVEVQSSKLYVLDSFYYSFPYLIPETKDFLDNVGSKFNALIDKTHLKGKRLIVTSLTRTTASVNKLVRVNRNASLRSPHLNGNSFDISFNHFYGGQKLDACDILILQETISKILYDLRAENKCWVTFERRQQCLHVVARKTKADFDKKWNKSVDFLHLMP